MTQSTIRMLSAHKPVLLIAASAAVAGSCLTVGLAALVHLRVVMPEAVRPFFGPILALTCIAFIAAIVLQLEYAQVLRGAQFQMLTEESLSLDQFLDSLRWCPFPVAIAALVLTLIGVVAFMAGGLPQWSSGQPLTAEAARAMLLFQAPFLLLSLPIVISGYRVPGSFSAQVGPDASPES